MSKSEKDAWRQEYELLGRFTKEWEVRHDLRVVGLACERTVRLDVAFGENPKFSMMPNWHYNQRNVSTMRELANALLAACDFVDQSNPVWASHHTALTPTDDFLVEDD